MKHTNTTLLLTLLILCNLPARAEEQNHLDDEHQYTELQKVEHDEHDTAGVVELSNESIRIAGIQIKRL